MVRVPVITPVGYSRYSAPREELILKRRNWHIMIRVNRVSKSLIVMLSGLLVAYSAAASVCDLSCSFMHLQSVCGTTSAIAEPDAPASQMDMSGSMDMDMPGMAMDNAANHSRPAQQQSSNHSPKSPSSCVHASCMQASASRRTSTTNQVHANFSRVTLLRPSPYNGIVFSQTFAAATASPPLVGATGLPSSPLRI